VLWAGGGEKNTIGEQGVKHPGHPPPGSFDFHLYASEASARSAIRDRDVYGAFVITDSSITVFEASAASATVAQLLTVAGQQLAGNVGGSVGGNVGGSVGTGAQRAAVDVTSVDVVPNSSGDPRGLVLSASLLPLTICSIIIASVIGLVVGFRPAWRQIVALAVVSAAAGLGALLIAQGFLGALPHEHLATWASLSLTMLAISSVTAGLIALIGSAGFGLGAILLVFVGNPFAGVTSAPQLLPDWVDHLGQWLPPGAGANLLRSTAYFDGHGAAGHLVVLILWTGFGLSAIVVGHHTSVRLAGHQSRLPAVVDRPASAPAPASAPS
ncbi:MAG: hypothetical protein ACR2N4_15465, partial [Jatrophihabitans sp.]